MSDPPPDKDRSWTILDLVRWASSDFTRLDLDSPRLDAELLLSHVLGCRRVDLYIRHEEVPGPERLASFRDLIRRRRKREPVAYIIGRRSFRDIELRVSPAVMVPRPETEILVDSVISCLKSSTDARRVLDLGTGSGAIALSIAKEFPGIEVWASDVSAEALDMAKENAELLGLKESVQFVKGNRFEPFSGAPPFDLIVSNPPYIPTDVISALMPEVRDHEPVIALDGGPSGFDFIFSILNQAPSHLIQGGWLWLEVGDDQARQVIAAAKNSFIHKETVRDYAGKQRVLGFSLAE